MSTMEFPTHDAAQAEVDRLHEQHNEWTQRRAALAAELEATRHAAGADALAGKSTAEIAERITRMQTEAQIAERALQALDTKIDEAKRVTRHARIADERQHAAQLREQAAAIIEAFKRCLAEAEQAKPKNPLMDSATRFPPRQ